MRCGARRNVSSGSVGCTRGSGQPYRMAMQPFNHQRLAIADALAQHAVERCGGRRCQPPCARQASTSAAHPCKPWRIPSRTPAAACPRSCCLILRCDARSVRLELRSHLKKHRSRMTHPRAVLTRRFPPARNAMTAAPGTHHEASATKRSIHPQACRRVRTSYTMSVCTTFGRFKRCRNVVSQTFRQAASADGRVRANRLAMPHLRQLGGDSGLPRAHAADYEQHQRSALEVEGAKHAVTRDEVVAEGSLAHDAEDGRLQLCLRDVQQVAVHELLLDVQCHFNGGVVWHLRAQAAGRQRDTRATAQSRARSLAAVSVRTSKKRLSTVACRSSPSPSQTRTFTKSYWLLECRTRGSAWASMSASVPAGPATAATRRKANAHARAARCQCRRAP